MFPNEGRACACVTPVTQLTLKTLCTNLRVGYNSPSAPGLWILFIGLWITLSCRPDGQVFALFPLVGYESKAPVQDRPGCYMDGEYHAFGDRWSPVFEPQGLMACVKCMCVEVDKKGITQFRGDTVCRNIKDLCPVPECDVPVLKPGKCCKSCKGNEDFESSVPIRKGATRTNDLHNLDEVKESSTQDFQAVLVGRHVFGGPTRTRAVALVNIRVTKGKVTFGLRYSKLDRPRSFMLQDIQGNVLFEKSLEQDIRGDKKVCAVWTKMPGLYLRFFRHEKLYATLTTSRYPGGVVAGKIIPTSGTNTETFSAILNPSRPDGNGGLVQIEHKPGTGHFSYSISLEAFRGSWKRATVRVAVLRGSSVLHQTVGSLQATTGSVSGSWKLSRRHRKQIARAQLSVKVTSPGQPGLKGTIRPRLQCGVLQAVLSEDHNVDHSTAHRSGSAVVQLREDGTLDFSMLVTGLTNNITRVRLGAPALRKGRNSRTVAHLFKSDNSSQRFPLQKWVHGSFQRLEAGDVSYLLGNQLTISVDTTRHRLGQLSGRLVTLEYDAQFTNTDTPMILEPTPGSVVRDVALVWLGLGPDCVLHFQVLVTGADRRTGSLDVALGSRDNRQRTFLLKQPVGTVQTISGYRHMTGETANIPDDLLLALDRGLAFVQVKGEKAGQAGFVANVTISNSCWRYSNDVLAGYTQEGGVSFLSNDHDDLPVCHFEGHIYEVASTWLPDVSPECVTCSCQANGEARCDEVICPALTCDSQQLKAGDCCPSCPSEGEARACQLGDDPRRYRVNSVWHPYMSMRGFEKCALCTCYPGGRVECSRLQCAALNCPKSQWVTNPTDPCCQQCRGAQISNEEPQQDQNIHRACTFRGEAKAHGDTWHPEIHGFGPDRCVTCECQDGRVACQRIKCPDLRCFPRVRSPSACCDECGGAL